MRLRHLALLTLATLTLSLVSGLISVSAGEPEPFPLPVLAPVAPPGDATPPLAVVSYGTTPGGNTFQVTFDGDVDVATAFQYRVDLFVGDPVGEMQRLRFLSEEGDLSGSLSEGDAKDDKWSVVGSAGVSLEGDQLDMDVPPELVAEEGDSAWLEVTLIREHEGDLETYKSTMVPAVDLLDPTDAQLTTADEAWGSLDQPPEPPVVIGPGPIMFLDGDELVVQFTAPTPTDVGGGAVTGVTDVVRISPSYADASTPPDLLVIDHARDSVSLLDGTTLPPVEVETDADWLNIGLPSRGVDEGDEVRVSLSDVLDAFDVDTAHLDENDQLGLGLARSISVDDGSEDGVVYRADGMMATAQWLAGNGPEPEVSATAAATGDARSPKRVQKVIVVGSIIAILGTVAFLVIRWYEHRRRMRAAMSVGAAPPRGVPEPTPEEQERLEEFTKQLFD